MRRCRAMKYAWKWTNTKSDSIVSLDADWIHYDPMVSTKIHVLNQYLRSPSRKKVPLSYVNLWVDPEFHVNRLWMESKRFCRPSRIKIKTKHAPNIREFRRQRVHGTSRNPKFVSIKSFTGGDQQKVHSPKALSALRRLSRMLEVLHDPAPYYYFNQR